jgi:hypothetical protein
MSRYPLDRDSRIRLIAMFSYVVLFEVAYHILPFGVWLACGIPLAIAIVVICRLATRRHDRRRAVR